MELSLPTSSLSSSGRAQRSHSEPIRVGQGADLSRVVKLAGSGSVMALVLVPVAKAAPNTGRRSFYLLRFSLYINPS